MKEHVGVVKSAKIANVISAILMVLGGFLLLFLPDMEKLSAQRILLGILFFLAGVTKMLGYYSNDLYRLAFQFDFAIGILCILLAALIAFLPERVFPSMPAIIGIYVILDSLLKLQIAFDAKRFGMQSWIAIVCSSLLLGGVGLFALGALYTELLPPSSAVGLALAMDGLQNAWITMHTVRVRARKKHLSKQFGLEEEEHEQDSD